MKKLTATLLATAVATVAMPTFADTGMYAGLKGGQMLIKRDFVKNVDGTGIIDGQNNNVSYGAVYAGYQVNQNIGVELEYGSTGTKNYNVSNSERVVLNPDGTVAGTIKTSGTTTEEKVQYLGAYVTSRYDLGETPLYVKGRVGVSQVKYDNKARGTVTTTPRVPETETDQNGNIVATGRFVDGDSTTNQTQQKRSVDKVSVAGGVALGVKPVKGSDKVALELEYNFLNKDVQSVGLGAQYNF